MGKTDSIIMGLFSGVAQGFGRRAFEERQRKERKEGQFTPLQKAQLDSFQSIINDPLQSIDAKVAAKKGKNELINVETPESTILKNTTARHKAAETIRNEQRDIKRFNAEKTGRNLDLQFENIKSREVRDQRDHEAKMAAYERAKKSGSVAEKRQAGVDARADLSAKNAFINQLQEERKQLEIVDLVSGKIIDDKENPKFIALTKQIDREMSNLEELQRVTGQKPQKRIIPSF